MKRTKKSREILRDNTVYGNEITNTARITKMNMILAGDGHSNVHMKDSLENPVNGQYDIVITNMPYSQRTNHGVKYDLPSKNGDSICVQHCIKAIRETSENGRMALVVPEGFLFRGDLAKVREYLLERCQLQSIISLPQGVFLPYTGVKTNIIYATNVNQKLAKKRKDYWYFDVKNDGYTLDNHRRKLNTPSDLDKYDEYRTLDNDPDQTISKDIRNEMLQVGFEIIPIDKVRENSFVLMGSRYRERVSINTKCIWAKLRDISTFIRGITFPKTAQGTEEIPEYLGIVTTKSAQSTGIVDDDVIFIDNSYTKDEKILKEGDILISLANSLNLVGRTTYVNKQHEGLSFGTFMGVIRTDRRKVLPKMLYYLLNSDVAKQYFLTIAKTTTNISNLTFEDIGDLVFPIPSLEMQQQIVDEIEDYQKIIDGARQIVENYKPKIKINPEWEMVELGEVCEVYNGSTPSRSNNSYWLEGTIPWFTVDDIRQQGRIINYTKQFITEKALNETSVKLLPINTVLLCCTASVGEYALTKIPLTTNQQFNGLVVKTEKKSILSSEYLFYIASNFLSELERLGGQTSFQFVSVKNVKTIKIPLPPLSTQQKIVEEIETEQVLIESAKKTIEVFTKKIQDRIEEIFGEKDT